MWPDHILFIHSSVDGHLGGLYLLAIVSNAAMNIGVHVSEPLLSIGYLKGEHISHSVTSDSL